MRRCRRGGPRPFLLAVLTGLVMAYRTAPATAAGADAGARKAAYYAVHYPGEQGPFASRQQAIDAALLALNSHAESEKWWTEWLTLVTRDRYGKWWHSLPKEGQVLAARQCAVSYSISEVRRPGSTLVSTVHTHPRGDVFPDPRPRSPDNQNPHEMFLLRSDGNVWFFRPHQTRPKLYGRVQSGVLESRYTGRNEPRLRSTNDADAILPGAA
jgi:hypothetical protein